MACTRFCEQPDLAHVGGTKDPDIAAIVDLAPDLVVMCDEENRREDADALEPAGLPVHSCSPRSVADVGAGARRHSPTRSGVDAGGRGGHDAERRSQPLGLRAFVPIWRRPWMSLAGDTYGSSVLAAIGVTNVFADAGRPLPRGRRSPTAQPRRPDLVLAPSEPYPVRCRATSRSCPSVAPVVLVDGQDLFWWGVRTPAAVGRLHAAIAPHRSTAPRDGFSRSTSVNRRAPAAGADDPALRQDAGLGQRDDAAAEAAAGHAGAVDARRRGQPVDERVDRRVDTSKSSAQAGVALRIRRPARDEVAGRRAPSTNARTRCVLGDDVAGPPAQHRVGHRVEVGLVPAWSSSRSGPTIASAASHCARRSA